jgi:hypothetical protein
MQHSVHPKWLTSSQRARLLALAAMVTAVLAAGCGGSSPTQPAAAVGGVSASGSSAASSIGATTAGSSTAAGGAATSSVSTTPRAAESGPLAFARCMRVGGVPNFPDPSSAHGGLFNTTGIDTSSPAFHAAQAKCQKLMGGGPTALGSHTHPTAQTMARLLRIARCMRQHGVPQFPDPQTSVPTNPTAGGAGVITDFDGAILLFPSTLDMQAPAYRHALTACGAPPLGLPH